MSAGATLSFANVTKGQASPRHLVSPAASTWKRSRGSLSIKLAGCVLSANNAACRFFLGTWNMKGFLSEERPIRTLREVLNRLRESYCGKIGYEVRTKLDGLLCPPVAPCCLSPANTHC